MNSFIKRCVLLLLLLLLLLAIVDIVHGDTGSASTSSDGVVDLSIIESAISSSTGIANASYAKSFTVGPPATQPDVNAVHDINIFLPGRVFINYVDYQDADDLVDSTTLMGVSLYNDTPELLDLVTIHGSTWIDEYGTFITIETNITTLTGNLLVEVSVFRRNQVRSLYGSADIDTGMNSLEIIVGDGVVRSGNDNSVEDRLSITVLYSTTLYLLSPSAALNLYSLDIILYGSASIYLEVDSLVTGVASFSIWDSASVVFLIDSLRASGDGFYMSFDDMGEACMAVRDTFEVSIYEIENPELVSFPLQTGGIEVSGRSECVKPQIPPFEPRDVSLDTSSFTPSNETSSKIGDSSSSSTSSSSSSSSSNVARSLRPMWLAFAALVLGSKLVLGW